MRYPSLLLALSAAFTVLSAPLAYASAPYWQWRNPTPQGNDFYDVAYGGGRFVAVGSVGAIATSTDGMTWTQVNSGLNVSLISVAYGNGRFVIFGGDRALVSEDGETWIQTFTPREGNNVPRYVAFAGDRFFAFSNYVLSGPGQDYIATSADGVNWTKSGTASAAHVGRVAYGGGSYVAQDMLTGGLGGGSGDWVINEVRMLRSTDGVNWVAGGLTGLAAVSAGPMYIDGRWMVGGTSVTQVPGERQQFWRAVSTSTDGGETWTLTWQDDVPRAGGNQVFYDFDAFAGRVVIMGDPNVPVTSTTDFVTFRTDVPSQMILLNAMASSPDAIVSVGRYGAIISSTDGTNWSSAHSNTVGGNLRAAAFGDGVWIVAGQSGLASSSDGIAWSMLPSGDTFDAGSLAYGNGRFVVGAMDGRIAVSTDKGATWSESGTRSTVLHFAFANGRFVGSSGLISSTDGLTWTAEVSPPGGTGRWLGVFTVGNVFYAVGTSDPDQTKDYVIARSTDGLSWTTVATMPERVLSVGGKEDLIIASGFLGEVWTSTDGLTFTQADGRPLLSFGPISSSQWVGDTFVGATYAGQIVMSVDGVNWAKDEFAGSGMMFGLATGNGQVLAVGNGGAIWEVGAARFTQEPESRTVSVGSPVTLSVAATGKEPLTYQWTKNGTVISGATRKSYAISSAGPDDAGDYRVVVSNSLGSTTSNPATLVVNQTAITKAPEITSQPQSKTVNAGAPVTFSVSVTGDTPLNYQWRHNNNAITGATGSTYTIPAATDSNSGTYSVTVWNMGGSITSHGATLTVNAAPASRLVSIATRAYATTNNGVTIGGFVIDGGSPKQVLMRAVGPSLASQGLPTSEVLADPTIELHHRGTILATNDDWTENSNAAAITETGLRIGATPLDANDTKSAAMLMTLDPGVYTFIAKGKNNTSGIVLIEVYDADVGGSSFAGIASRALSVTGNNVAIGGFVVTGTTPKQVMMRAVGSSLALQGLPESELLLDPTIELHRGSTILATNDNWGDNDNAAAIVTEGARIGATPLGANDTKSAVLLMTLQPGVYSFIVKGANNSTGLVLVEVYDAD